MTKILNQLVSDALLDKKDIRDVVVFGGSVFGMALIKEFVHKFLDQKEVNDYSLSDFVAKGSAICHQWSHKISFKVNDCNEFIVSLNNESNIYPKTIGNVLLECRLGLNNEDFNRDKRFVALIWSKSKEMKASIEKTSKVNDLKEELWALYKEIKERVDSRDMSGLKKRKITEQLKQTETILKDEGTDANDLEVQKSLLEGYKQIL